MYLFPNAPRLGILTKFDHCSASGLKRRRSVGNPSSQFEGSSQAYSSNAPYVMAISYIAAPTYLTCMVIDLCPPEPSVSVTLSRAPLRARQAALLVKTRGRGRLFC